MQLPSIKEFLADKSWHGCSVAHRGAWHRAAENSLLAIDHAVDIGCAFAEIDVQETFDGVPFCLHDLSLLRTAGRDLHAAAHHWSQIETTPLLLGAGGRGVLLSDQKLPSLAEMLTHAAGRIYLDLDVKRPHQLPMVAKAVHQAGVADTVNLKMWIHGRADFEYALQLHQTLNVLIKPILLVEQGNWQEMFGVVQALDAPMVEAKFDRWDTVLRLTDACWAEGRDVFVNTLDDAPSTFVVDSAAAQDPGRTWGALLDAGVRLLQTDEPEALGAYLGRHRKEKG